MSEDTLQGGGGGEQAEVPSSTGGVRRSGRHQPVVPQGEPCGTGEQHEGEPHTGRREGDQPANQPPSRGRGRPRIYMDDQARREAASARRREQRGARPPPPPPQQRGSWIDGLARRTLDQLSRHGRRREASSCPVLSVTPSRQHFMEAWEPITVWFERVVPEEELIPRTELWSAMKPLILEALTFHCVYDDRVMAGLLTVFARLSKLPEQYVLEILDAFLLRCPRSMGADLRLPITRGVTYFVQVSGLEGLSAVYLRFTHDERFISRLADAVFTVSMSRNEEDYLTSEDLRFLIDGFHYFSNLGLRGRSAHSRRYAVHACLATIAHFTAVSVRLQLRTQDIAAVREQAGRLLAQSWDGYDYETWWLPAGTAEWQRMLTQLETGYADIMDI
jgi:hypothetical protein